MPSTMSLVSLNGTLSGVLRNLPCSKAMPRSMCTISALEVSISRLAEWRSPRPIRYPAMELTAVDRVYQSRLSNQTAGSGKRSRKK